MGFQLNNIVRDSEEENEIFKKPSFLEREISIFKTTFSNKIKEDFYSELSVLLEAGITLKDALGLIQKALKKKSHQDKIKNISKAIVSGLSLSDAIKTQKDFTDYEYYSLNIGEETGTLKKVSKQLSAFYARKNKQRRNLISALTYPIIILITALLVIIFMLRYVVPMFQNIFKQQQVELPAITQFIIFLSNFLKNYFWFIALLVILFVFLRTFLNKKKWYRKTMDVFILKIPFIGNFVKLVYLSQFLQSVSLLTASKVPLIDSIKLVKKMIDFYPLQVALESVESNILRGKSLSESLKQSKLFDFKLIALVEVAEETNRNEFIFNRLTQQYNEQVEQQSKLLSTLIEPIIILIVGILVGLILIAMYLPMFKLSSVLG